MIELIFKTLKSVHEATFLSIAPPDFKPPFCVFTLVSDVLPDLISSYSHSEQHFQLDVYSSSAREATGMKQQLIKAVDVLNVSDLSSVFSYERETNLYRYLIEFSIIKGE